MPEKLRVGVIGCGQISYIVHSRDYASCPDAELVAFCDIVEEKAEAHKANFAPKAKTYTDYEEMLKEAKLDAVSIGTPNYVHAPIAIAALKAGCHVLVEKPMAASLDEAKEMVATAKSAGKVLMVNQSQRIFPTHAKAKEVLDSGIMGKVLHVTAMFGHSGPEYWSPTGAWFFKKDEARFGAMADLGVHKADLIRYLTGKEITEISAYTALLEKQDKGDVEDNFTAAFKFEDGAVGTVAASWTVKGAEANSTLLYCENGTLSVAAFPGRPLVANLIKPVCEIDFPVPPAVTNDDLAWGLDISGRFVRAIQGVEAPYCTGEEGLKSLAVILAAEESALTGKSVPVKS